MKRWIQWPMVVLPLSIFSTQILAQQVPQSQAEPGCAPIAVQCSMDKPIEVKKPAKHAKKAKKSIHSHHYAQMKENKSIGKR